MLRDKWASERLGSKTEHREMTKQTLAGDSIKQEAWSDHFGEAIVKIRYIIFALNASFLRLGVMLNIAYFQSNVSVGVTFALILMKGAHGRHPISVKTGQLKTG